MMTVTHPEGKKELRGIMVQTEPEMENSKGDGEPIACELPYEN